MANKIIYFLGVLISSLLISSGAYAAVDIEVAYIFNTFSFLVCAFLVMWMAAGFCMLESGLVTTKSVSTIAAKNIGKFAIVSVMFYLVGYNLGYGDSENPYFGSFEIWTDNSSLETGYSDYSDWLFQTLFVCATCSIVSGAVAERIKIWPFFIFSAILGGFIYPIQMSWEWGGGWLDSLGFADFAGSTLVHACGGAAALAGIMILGPRLGRFTDDGSPQNMAPFAASSIPLVTLGTFILWMGWYGFNGIDPRFFAEQFAYFLTIVAGLYFIYLFLFAGLNASERKNLILLFLLFIGAAAFWSGFDQSAGSLNIFARDYTDLSVAGYKIPVGWLQFANPIIVVLFAPIFAGIWAQLARKNLDPSLPFKFAIGLLFMALSFFVMIIAVNLAIESSPVGMQWLLLTYLFQTWGELALSPIGLSAFSRYGPKRYMGQMFGLWFLASAIGGVLAGLLGGEALDGGLETISPVFEFMIQYYLVIAVALIALSFVIKTAKE